MSKLAEALQHSKAFIALYSPYYFQNVFCGKEWQVFSSRLQTYDPAAPLIIPVLWFPVGDNLLPPVAKELQYAHEALGEKYAKEGLEYLIRLNDNKEYEEFMTRLAQRIIHVVEKHKLSSLPKPPDILHIPEAFPVSNDASQEEPPQAERRGPKRVVFVLVVGQPSELEAIRREVSSYGIEPDDWQPYYPPFQRRIGPLVQGIAADEDFTSSVIPATENLVNELEKLYRRNNIVVLIVDNWTLKLQTYHELMRSYDEVHFLNCGVLIPWNDQDSETQEHRDNLKTWIKYTFQNKVIAGDLTSFRDEITTLEKLKTELRDTLVKLQNRILDIAKVARKAEGDTVIARPQIAGPGGH